MNKKLLLILISSILTLALLIFFIVMSGDFFVGEKVLLQIAKDAEKTYSSDFEDSPFGFHMALANVPGYSNNGYEDTINLGVKWAREGLYAFWFIIQPDLEKQEYDFSKYDSQWKDIPTDLTIVANIAPEPNRNEIGYCIAGSWTPVDEEKYITFVKAVIERYDGDGIDDMPGLSNPIKYWQLGNEMEQSFDMGRTQASFARLQKITYESIKEACSNCKVLIGGVANPEISNFNKKFLPVFEALSEYNEQYFDIVDIHVYDDAKGDYKNFKANFENIKTQIDSLGLSPKSGYWISEGGTYSGSFGSKSQTEFEQAMDMVKRFVLSFSLGVEKMFWFTIMEGYADPTDGDVFDFLGLIYDGRAEGDKGVGVKKLSYYTYKLMVEKLEGSDWDNIQTIQESDNIYIYKFTKNGAPFWVAWWDYFDDAGTSKTISLDVGSISSVKITEAVPKYETGQEVTDYSTAFNTETKTTSGGKVEIILGESPVFVEGK